MGMYGNTFDEQSYHNDSKDIGPPAADRGHCINRRQAYDKLRGTYKILLRKTLGV